MEQARYWMWAKKKPDVIGDSWEEQAFAEDAAGTLGGSVWPPRSYSCSFCRREFRSAQALGGHMNVHRRDRARLKESPHDVVVQDPAPPLNNRSISTTFLYNNDRYSPNPEFPEIRVSSTPAAVMVTDIGQKNTTISFLPPRNDIVSWENLFPASRACCVAEKRDREDGSSCRRKRAMSSEDEVVSCKRVRIEEKPSSLFPKLRAVVVRSVAQSEVSKLCPGLVEEVLDLELRLGNAPKVK